VRGGSNYSRNSWVMAVICVQGCRCVWIIDIVRSGQEMARTINEMMITGGKKALCLSVAGSARRLGRRGRARSNQFPIQHIPNSATSLPTRGIRVNSFHSQSKQREEEEKRTLLNGLYSSSLSSTIVLQAQPSLWSALLQIGGTTGTTTER
jgi:hypothetical protein